jgi:hypothetical protein
MNTETSAASFEPFNLSLQMLRHCMHTNADCWSRANRMQAEWFDLYNALAQRELRSMTGAAQSGDWFAEQMRIFLEFGNRFADCSQRQMAALTGDYWDLLMAAWPAQAAKTAAVQPQPGSVTQHPVPAKPKPAGSPS